MTFCQIFAPDYLQTTQLVLSVKFEQKNDCNFNFPKIIMISRKLPILPKAAITGC